MTRGARSGTAALETALCLPVLLMMICAIADLGLALYGLSRMTAAVAAGAQYATLRGVEASAGTIRDLIEAAADSTTATVDTATCYCVDEAAIPAMTVKACSDSCADGVRPPRYAVISATYRYRALTPATQLALPSGYTVATRVPLR